MNDSSSRPAARSLGDHRRVEPAAPLADLRLLGRHQIAAALATLVDFSSMVALVELFGASPAYATLLSAAAGGVTNFTLGRTWAFRALHRGSMTSQALRYAVVCAGGALLNASLLGAVLAVANPSYLVTRAVVSILVSLAYTYPMHARFVFRAVEPERGEDGAP
ncbi:MAG: GtrA family protein [Labilithrix sp.]|nr:GtrA family protein [Labilithrix sp.]MCW5832683.1 GtrA family protein [Labilithrix sp.]